MPKDYGKNSDSEYLLVDRRILPDVYSKVVEAKWLLVSGKVSNYSEAAKAAGISRSALYKYKDYVFMYHARMEDKMVTLFASLEDRPGVLSGLLNYLSLSGSNILTINQNIPVDGVAPVTISVRIAESLDPAELLSGVGGLEGVVRVRILTTV